MWNAYLQTYVFSAYMTGPDKINKPYPNPFDDRNFNRIFEALYAPLCHYCMKFVNDRNMAEDIVQDQFVYIWENRERLKEYASIDSYLYKAVKNRSLNYLQKKFKSKILNQPDELSRTDVLREEEQPDKLLENKELALTIQNALEALPPKCRTIFLMKRYGELTNKEIAEKLDISVKTVESQMTIALKKLTALITPER